MDKKFDNMQNESRVLDTKDQTAEEAILEDGTGLFQDRAELGEIGKNIRKYNNDFKSDRIIEIKKASKDYGKGRGIFDIDLLVKRGEVVGFLGPNGAGKTTTLRALTGFIKLDRGIAAVEGLDSFKKRHRINDFLGYVPSDVSFFDEMTGDKFLNYLADIRNLDSMETANDLIERFELDTTVKIKKMSKGNKQKLAIVTAMMHDPDVLVLDEPTTGLDPIMQNKFNKLILDLKAEGKTILISSHIFDEVSKICDKVAIIKEGKIVAFDDISELRKSKNKIFDIQFASEREALNFEIHHSNAERTGMAVKISMKGEVTGLVKELSNYNILDIDVHQMNLEELFLHYYGGEDNE